MTRPRTAPERYLTAAQVAAAFHVHAKTIGRWARDGKLPFLRTLGGHRRFPEAAIRALADSTADFDGETALAAGVDPSDLDGEVTP